MPLHLPRCWTAVLPAKANAAGFGLYVHWPFCQSKCPYCDFNSHVSATIDQDEWIRAYSSEIARLSKEIGGRRLSSIYFGGGTPSLMEPRLVERIIADAQRAWKFENDIEITLEANPSSVETDRLRGYQLAGVNRVSLGVQALNDTDLRALGRLHSVEEAVRAVEKTASLYERYSFDLIYARQNQTLEEWRSELGLALEMGADHMSLYQLTIEPGTAFGDRFDAGKLNGLPVEDLAADMFEMTQEMTISAGLEPYEVSNHARDGHMSRHNLLYWTGGDYAGIGPGAHGRLTIGEHRFATETPLSPAVWLQNAMAGNAEAPRRRLSKQDQAGEALMMGLRTSLGVGLDRIASLQDAEFDIKINNLEEIGMVVRTGTHLIATPAGRPLLNEILRQLLVV